MTQVALREHVERGPVFVLDPLTDPRWRVLVAEHPRASVFHTAGWLDALRRTYGYTPSAVTTTPPSEPLTNGIVFCRVQSWLTGTRLVSLPFSDHCEPLVQDESDMRHLVLGLESELKRARQAEIRTAPRLAGTFTSNGPPAFCLHRLDLTRTPDQLFARLHKDCIQRKIRRAGREKLAVETGRSEELLRLFYRLFVRSRRRQKVPPQPWAWFQNLKTCMGDSLTVHVASKGKLPIASIVTLANGRRTIYKYGCSDRKYNNLGGMQLLLWSAILEARSAGAVEFDFGRSAWDNPGLIRFKDRWGAVRSDLVYLQFPSTGKVRAAASWRIALAKRVAACTPQQVVVVVGRQLYRHLGCV